MARVLILFASSHGQTREIAWTIERHLRRRGHAVDLVEGLTAATGWQSRVARRSRFHLGCAPRSRAQSTFSCKRG